MNDGASSSEQCDIPKHVSPLAMQDKPNAGNTRSIKYSGTRARPIKYNKRVAADKYAAVISGMLKINTNIVLNNTFVVYPQKAIVKVVIMEM